MTIASEITNYANGLSDAYDAVSDMQGLIPQDKNMNNLDTAIRTIPQNQGATTTTFHWGGSPSYSMYKDSGYTTAATYSDIATAYADGLVFIADGEDETTYVMVSDIPDAYTITVTGIGLPDNKGGSTSYAYASSTWTKTATTFQNELTAGSNIQINGATISATDTTYSNFTGATSQTDGSAGLVPKPIAGDETKFLSGNGQWTTVSQYNLPIASANDLGGIKVGNNLTIDSSTGVLDATDTTYTAGTNVQISAGNVISATDTTYSAFTGATDSTAGTSGLVIAPAAGDNLKALYGDGTWKLPGMTILKYGTSTYAEALAAYQANNVVYCRASSNSNPGSGNQLRMAFLAYVNDEGTPTEFEFQYYRSVATHSDSTQGDEVFVYKLNSSGTWSVTKRNAYSKIVAGTNMTSSYSSGTLTLNATDTTYSDFTGATSSVAGTNGLVPAPTTSDPDKFLKGDGTWGTPADTTYVDFIGADGVSAGTEGLVPAPAATDNTKFLKGDGTWDTVPFTITPATTSVIGGVIVGSGLSVAADGTISADTQISPFTTQEWNTMWA